MGKKERGGGVLTKGVVQRRIPPCHAPSLQPRIPLSSHLTPAPCPRIPSSSRLVPTSPCPCGVVPSLRRRPVLVSLSPPEGGGDVAWGSSWRGRRGGLAWWGSRSRWRGGGCRGRCRVQVVVVVDDVAWRGVDVLVASSTWRSLSLLWLHRRGVVVSGRRHGRPVVVVEVAPSSLSSWRCRRRVSTHIS